MTWLREVGHVLAKDVREQRRFVALYVVVVAAATVRAVAWTLPTFGVASTFGVVLVMLALFLAAAAVQGDSPSRADAFWASHPFDRSAMLAAKVAFALVLVVIGAVGQAIAVASYDVHGAALVARTVGPVLEFAALLLAAMVLGALTRDLRSFALSVIVLLVVFLATALMLAPSLDVAIPLRAATIVAIAGAAIELAILAWVYKWRDTRLAVRAGGYVAVLSALLLLTASSSPARESIEAPASARVPLEIATVMNQPRVRPLEIAVQVRLPAQPLGSSYFLDHPVLTLRLNDGSVMHLSTTTSGLSMFWGPQMVAAPMPGVHWIGIPEPHVAAFSANAALTPAQRRAIDRAGIADVEITARVVVMQARVLATMPLTSGATTTFDGRRVHVSSWAHDYGVPDLSLQWSSLNRDAAPAGVVSSVNGLQFAVVNEARGEALPLGMRQGGGGLGGLVLPGSGLTAQTVRLGGSFGVGPVTMLDDAWYAGAKLLVLDEVAVGGYDLRLPYTGPR